jgi:hypothetical protein
MGSRFVLSIGTMGLALATAFAPRAEAQARNPITVCRNGARINSEDSHACDRSGGMDLQKTAIARRDAEVRAQQTVQQQSAQNTNGDDRYGRTNDGRNNDDRYGRNDDDRYGRNDNGRWDDHDNGRRGNDGKWNGHDNGRRGHDGRYSNAPREVFRWQGLVDKEVRIQLQGGRSYVQPIGNREVRNGNGQMLGGLPHQDGILRIERIEGRGDIDVIQQPTAANGYQATLRVRDPRSGASNYRLVAVWQPLYNNGRYGRN